MQFIKHISSKGLHERVRLGIQPAVCEQKSKNECENVGFLIRAVNIFS